MGIKEDIIANAKKNGIDPYTQPFKPSALGMKASKYGAFADYCAKDDALSGKHNSKVILKVFSRNNGGKPVKYLLKQPGYRA